MNRIVLLLVTSIALCLAILATKWDMPADRDRIVTAHAPSLHEASSAPIAEVMRLRAHFRTVLLELESADVSGLAPAQRRERARHVEALRSYAEAGVFPHNHDVPGERVPYFVDEHGTLCAMAFLIARSGGEELVEAVAATRNNATIRELVDMPELIVWLDENGLSVAEAAHIQPAYDPQPPLPEEPGISARYALGSVLASGVGGAAIVLNLGSDRSDDASLWHGLMGLAAGAAGMALGADAIGDGGTVAALGAVNAGIGLTSLGLGARTLFRLLGDDREESISASQGLLVTASPMVGVEGRTGFVLRASF